MDTPGLLVAFGAGLISFLSPCVLPLVPGYLSLMSGLQPSTVGQPTQVQRGQLFIDSLLFVLGFTLVFVLYGAVASGIGSLFLERRDLLARIAGVAIILMGLAVAGLLKVPFLQSTKRLHVSPKSLGPFAAPAMGMAFAFGWTPCIGPILAAVLTLAAGRETLSEGVQLLSVYSLGLGVPFVIMAVAFGRLRAGQKWFVRHGRTIDLISGSLLVAFGFLLLSGQLGWLSRIVLNFWNSVGFSGVFG